MLYTPNESTWFAHRFSVLNYWQLNLRILPLQLLNYILSKMLTGGPRQADTGRSAVNNMVLMFCFAHKEVASENLQSILQKQLKKMPLGDSFPLCLNHMAKNDNWILIPPSKTTRVFHLIASQHADSQFSVELTRGYKRSFKSCFKDH